VLGVRPEDVVVSTSPVEGGLEGEVYLVEDLGNDRYADVRIGGQTAVARLNGDLEPDVGDRLWLSFDPARAHLFDPTTEQHVV
jgi:multiple sugar transport system ATP-binding protein